MIKVLFVKQLREMTAFLYISGKKGKRRSKAAAIGYGALMVYAFGCIGFLCYVLASMLCAPLVQAQMDWLYFAMMGSAACALGVFGSVFSTYSGLYAAKDNELLLAMPIAPGQILLSRMLVLYVLSFFMEALILVPSAIVYWENTSMEVMSVIGCVLVLVLLPLLALVICCILGWLIALASPYFNKGSQMKSVMMLVLTVAFLGVYYYVFFQMNKFLQDMILNAREIGDGIRLFLYPIYQMGRAAIGEPDALVIFSALVLVIFAAVWLVLSKSFLKLATANRGAVKKKYREKAVKASGVGAALLKKEWSRFTHVSVYMLNCGLGSVLLLIAAGFLVIKKNMMTELIDQLSMVDPSVAAMIPLIACGIIAFMTGMDAVSAPSVSLEGQTLWLMQSLPVSAWDVFSAKIRLHILINGIPTLILCLVLDSLLRPNLLAAILIPAVSLIFIVFGAVMGLAVNLKFPNLNWTNETVVVKQSMSVMIVVFGNMGVIGLLAGGYALLYRFLSADLYLLFCGILLAVAATAATIWLKRTGTKIFARL